MFIGSIFWKFDIPIIDSYDLVYGSVLMVSRLENYNTRGVT